MRKYDETEHSSFRRTEEDNAGALWQISPPTKNTNKRSGETERQRLSFCLGRERSTVKNSSTSSRALKFLSNNLLPGHKSSVVISVICNSQVASPSSICIK